MVQGMSPLFAVNEKLEEGVSGENQHCFATIVCRHWHGRVALLFVLFYVHHVLIDSGVSLEPFPATARGHMRPSVVESDQG